MSSKLRSSSGCWTCRLRRKKCDETKPQCRRCTKLQLECEGSAERPVWMDGGELEKLKLEQTKRLVRESMGLGSKRRRQLIGTRKLSDESFSTSSGAVSSRLTPPLPTGEESGIASGLQNLDPLSNYEDGFDLSFQFDEINMGNNLSGPDHKSYGGDKVQEYTLSNQQISTSTETPFVDACEIPYPEEFYDSLLGSQYPNASSSDSSSDFSGSGGQAQSSNRPSTPEEGDLLLYYLEHVCQKQLLTIAKTNRGWLYMAITRTDVVYWATLGLASYYQGAGQLVGYVEQEYAESCSRVVVLFLQQSGKTGATGDLEACQMHLHTACNLLTNFQRTVAGDGISELTMIISGWDAVNSAMLPLVVTTLRWFDVLLSCSLRTLPSMSTQLLVLLQLQSNRNLSQMANNITYQGRVTTSLAEVLEHDHWKMTLAQAGRLSVVELVQSAAAIENNMLSDQETSELEAACRRPSIYTNGETLLYQVARIFTSTTRVYLNVTVSGSHREVPEIQKGVAYTVALFRGLLSVGALGHVAWPFCFIGCLATGDERELMAGLMHEVLSQDDCPLSIKWASTIIKECWRLLDEEILVHPDWVSAMNSLKCQFIIF
ncbi:hypothetical protein BP5796_12626 [Coleophoma crateriformis]|uniref:Zn(2)-C6 fungal-type domain-containing protein n=1 Tax=Coleophoma crateriformis TaxID=565419 RepID=A0A3D8Q7L1_9HELO|nr:hypothetical protein BP5796_12626 [Coleophoma crateriformis]